MQFTFTGWNEIMEEGNEDENDEVFEPAEEIMKKNKSDDKDSFSDGEIKTYEIIEQENLS